MTEESTAVPAPLVVAFAEDAERPAGVAIAHGAADRVDRIGWSIVPGVSAST